MITKIRVPARYYIPNDDFFSTVEKMSVAEFTLGLGPCGKVVTALEFTDGNNFIAIRQIHVDGSFKIFYYRHADLIGRIEIEEN